MTATESAIEGKLGDGDRGGESALRRFLEAADSTWLSLSVRSREEDPFLLEPPRWEVEVPTSGVECSCSVPGSD